MEMYWDCATGISGDLTLAALAHLGVDFAPFAASLERAGVACVIECREESRAGGPGFCVDVRWREEEQPLRVCEAENTGVAWFSLADALAASTEPWFIERIYKKLNEKLNSI